jgi:hypothetical protein
LGDDAAFLGDADLSKFFEALQMEGDRVVNYRETVEAFRAR